jgi:hypothetical protein
MLSYHGVLPRFRAESVRPVILSSSSWPDRCHLSHTGGNAKVAEDAENETVNECDGAARTKINGQDGQRASQTGSRVARCFTHGRTIASVLASAIQVLFE